MSKLCASKHFCVRFHIKSFPSRYICVDTPYRVLSASICIWEGRGLSKSEIYCFYSLSSVVRMFKFTASSKLTLLFQWTNTVVLSAILSSLKW